jgi:hypothetical protein
MTNFANILPNNALTHNLYYVNDHTKLEEEIYQSKTPYVGTLDIESQHKKWIQSVQSAQNKNLRTKLPLLARINQYSNLQIAIIGALSTAFLISIAVSILMIID